MANKFAALQQYATDLKAEVEGIETEIRPGIWFTVARSDNDEYFKFVLEAIKPHVVKLGDNKPTEEYNEAFLKIQTEAFAKYIVRGWRGIDEPYTHENSIELFSNKEFKDIRKDIQKVADTAELYRKGFVEQTKSKA